VTQVHPAPADTPEGSAFHMPRMLTQGEQTAISVTAAAVALLGLVGFVVSFTTVMDAAEPAFGMLAFLVPLGIDLGIAIFSALDITLARLNMRIRWLRLIPWALVGATIYLNIAGQHAPFGVVAHAALPLLWIVAVEVGAHVLRKRAGLADPDRMDRVRVSRWLLAPRSTFGLWRRMILWEIRSYPGALSRERDRVLAKTHLQDGWGTLWRWKAPRRARALYKLGELAPADLTPTLADPAANTPPELPQQPESETPEVYDETDAAHPDPSEQADPETTRAEGKKWAAVLYQFAIERGVEVSIADLARLTALSRRQASYVIADVTREREEMSDEQAADSDPLTDELNYALTGATNGGAP
jgi:hypothetical protein